MHWQATIAESSTWRNSRLRRTIGKTDNMSDSRSNMTTGQRWYQTKRVPLYIMVAGGFAFAATHLLGNRATHPMVEAGQSQKNDSLSEEREGSHESGKKHFESSGRQASRASGFHEGQNTDGIFPNAAIAKKLGEVMGDPAKDDSPPTRK